MFGRQRLIRWLPSTSIFRKMLRCKSRFTKYAKIYISTLFTPQYKLLNKISMLIPNLINMCIHRLYILHQGCLLQGHPALDRVRYAAGHQKKIKDFSNENLVYSFRASKTNSLNLELQNKFGLFVLKTFFQRIKF